MRSGGLAPLLLCIRLLIFQSNPSSLTLTTQKAAAFEWSRQTIFR
jgi:hypothetical protein